MYFKDAPARIHLKEAAEGAAPTGEFEALVSVFGNVDFVGDRVVKGAFAKSIDRWGERGDSVPIIYSHAHQDPNALLGGVTEMAEHDDGLWVKGALDLDMPAAAAVYRHMKARRLTKFSFAYDVLDAQPAKDNDDITELTELDIIEVGPTVIPANNETELLAVKANDLARVARAAKAGRVLSAKNEAALRSAAEAITDVLNQLGDTEASKTQTPYLTPALRNQVGLLQIAL